MNLSIRSFAPFVCLVAATVAIGAENNLSFLTQQLSFEPNVGQSDSSGSFLSRGPGYLVKLASDHVTFQVNSTQSIQMNLLRARSTGALEGESLLPGKANYFPSADKSQWHTNIPTYKRIAEHDIFPGVDVAFYGNRNRLEYDFVVRPNASVDQIQLRFSGADRVSLDSHGNLQLGVGQRELSLLKPVVYQMANDGESREMVQCSYRLNSESGLLNFAIGAYDHARPLTIDPVLSYSGYLSNTVNASTMDKAGNVYVVNGSDYAQSSITKLSAAGMVVYTTSFGTGISPLAVAVDSTGKAYIAGQASYSSTLPVTSNSYSSVVPQYASAFFLQISANGSSVPYATYLGGLDNTNNGATAITVDSSGNAYLAGYTQSVTFPTTTGAYQKVNPPNTLSGFVAKFNPTLSGQASLIYSTLMGTSADGFSPILNGIAVDVSGNAYVTGRSASGYPVTNGAFQYSGFYNNGGGVYVTKFNPAGTALVYSAYLGYGTGTAIAVDLQGNAYVTGTVGYADFPVTSGAYQTIYPGGFVTKLNPAGSAEVYSTFLGGPSSIEDANVAPTSIALTPGCPATTPSVVNCNAFITGTTTTTDFPAINAIQAAPAALPPSAFVTELSASGQSALLSTYFSGTAGVNNNYGPFVAVDSAGNVNVTGNLPAGIDNPGLPVTVSTSVFSGPAFFARISPASGGELLALTAPLNIGSTVGVSSILLGTPGLVTLGNFGSSAVTIASIQASPSVFTQTNTCGTSLAAGGSCVLTVNFTPAAASTTSGSITVATSAANSPLKVSLTGTGYNSSYLKASTSPLNFAAQNINTASPSQTVVVSNGGNTAAALVLSVNPVDFSLVSNCPASLAAHSTCNVGVTFIPSQPGLREGYLQVSDSVTGQETFVNVTGTGKVPTLTPSITVAPTALQFTPEVVGANTSIAQAFNITNTSGEPITLHSVTAAGDFHVTSVSCDAPGEILPETSCQVNVMFVPTATGNRTGSITVSTSVSVVLSTVTLSGTGLASTEKVELYPSTSVLAPDQPVGTTGPDQAITFQNTGTSPISIYRVLVAGPFRVSGDPCSSSTVAGTSDDGSGVYSFCQITVDFVPTAIGLATGTLTFYDSAPGSPHIVSLSGTGITATGTLTLSNSAFIFPALAVGTTSGPLVAGSVQDVTLYNPGDSPIQVTAISVSGDFSETPGYCGPPPFTINPGETACILSLLFSPTTSGTRNGTLTVHSSAGVQTAALTGTGAGTAPSNFLQMIPTGSMSFGSQLVGQAGITQTVEFYASEVESNPFPQFSLSGPNSADFSVEDNSASCQVTNTGISFCTLIILFKPAAAGTRTATITFTDWAGTQTLNLAGTGLTSTPPASIFPHFITFPPQPQGTTSTGVSVTFTNNGKSSVLLGNVAVTANFIAVHGTAVCSGSTLAVGQSCNLQVEYVPAIASPAGNRLDSGTVTFKDSGGNVLSSLAMAGYSLTPAYSAQVSHTVINFAQQQGLGSTSDYQTYVTLHNTGNTALAVGAISGTNLGLAGSSAEFSVLPANQGADYCSGTTLQPGDYCSVFITFTPNVLGASSGALNFPVTYANNTKATLQVKLNGVAVAAKDQAYLSPASLTFADLGVGTTSAVSVVTLTNTGNEPVTVGVLTGINTIVGGATTGEFSTNSTYAKDGCSLVSLVPGGSCFIRVMLTPSATGNRTGTINFPLTYQDQHTASLVLTLSGTGLGVVRQLEISPLSVAFTPAIQNDPNVTVEQSIFVTNTGNAPVTFGKDALSASSADFQILADTCAATALAAEANCFVILRFNPAATSTGMRTGALTIADNATGGPHTIPLSGNAITSAQQVELSQTALNFGIQKAGTSGNAQVVYVSNQGPLAVQISNVVLGGTNAADFQLSNGCYYLQGSCIISVAFAPQPGVSGTRTATIIETDSAPGSPRVITLTGTAN